MCYLNIPKGGLHDALYAGVPAPYWAPPDPFPSEPPITSAVPKGGNLYWSYTRCQWQCAPVPCLVGDTEKNARHSATFPSGRVEYKELRAACAFLALSHIPALTRHKM